MEEDMILPDDFDATPSTAEGTEDSSDTVEAKNTAPEENINTTEPVQTQEPYKFKVKFNHQEMEIPEPEAIPLIQKGMNYDKTIERLNQLQNDPRLSFVEELARENGMNVEQYLQEVRRYREQERLNQLVQQNIPEEYAREILENRKFREQFESEKQQEQRKKAEDAMYAEFFASYPEAKPEDIASETWEKVSAGVPLKYAYMEQKMNDMANKVKMLEQNQQNKQKAPISTAVTSHGSESVESEDDFLSGFNSI